MSRSLVFITALFTILLTTASQVSPAKKDYIGSILVKTSSGESADTTMKDHIHQALRQLSDVEVVETDINWRRWTLVVVHSRCAKGLNTYSFTVMSHMPGNWINPNLDEDFKSLALRDCGLLEMFYVFPGNAKSLEDICVDIVAAVDSRIFEEVRQNRKYGDIRIFEELRRFERQLKDGNEIFNNTDATQR